MIPYLFWFADKSIECFGVAKIDLYAILRYFHLHQPSREAFDLAVWHGDLRKRKPSGGKKRSWRKKRRFEKGSFPAETKLSERKVRIVRVRGGGKKIRLLGDKVVNISDPSTGKTTKTEIIRVLENPANIDYNRRGVLTKGALIETPLGTARVTSRPGQNGVINATLTITK